MKKWWQTAGAVIGLCSGYSIEAVACGGCFAPPPSGEPSIVTGHRMAFAISEARTVLWDQFQYSGAPEDFSWVLPIKPGAFIEVAEPAFLTALDEFTQPVVYAPPTSCSGQTGGCACGFLGGASAADGGAYYYTPDVQVLSRETVGPYDTVVLRSQQSDALQRWLSQNGYVLPLDVEPIVAEYVKEGFDFLALRLSPGRGVDQMEPVRVTTPGGDPQLPLRMVAAGIGDSVSLTLFVLGAGRQAITDLVDFEVDAQALSFDFDTGENNYAEVAAEIFGKVDGRVHITGYASSNPFLTQRDGQYGYPVTYAIQDGYGVTELEELYFRTAIQDSGVVFDGRMSTCLAASRPYSNATRVVARCGDAPCPPDDDWAVGSGSGSSSGTGGQGGASSGTSQGGAGASPGGAAGSSTAEKPDPSAADYPADSSGHFVCGPFTDIEAALIGQVPRDLWLTRLDMNLPREALDMDCRIVPAAGGKVSGTFVAEKLENDPCATAVPRLPPEDPRRYLLHVLTAAGAILFGLRRFTKNWTPVRLSRRAAT